MTTTLTAPPGTAQGPAASPGLSLEEQEATRRRIAAAQAARDAMLRKLHR